MHFLAGHFDVDAAADQPRAAARQIDGVFLRRIRPEQRFLHRPANSREHGPLACIEFSLLSFADALRVTRLLRFRFPLALRLSPSPLSLNLLLDILRQRQIEIIAAEDQMIADGDAMELHFAAFAAADANEREVGSSAADIADQNLLARRDQLLPIGLMGVNPGVKSGLRLFDQHHARQTGRRRRFDGQLPGDLVERGRQREHEILLFQRLAGKAMVPSIADVGEIPRADFDRREFFHVLRPAPRQNRRRPIHARMTEPRLGRVDQPARRERALLAGEEADDVRKGRGEGDRRI